MHPDNLQYLIAYDYIYLVKTEINPVYVQSLADVQNSYY